MTTITDSERLRQTVELVLDRQVRPLLKLHAREGRGPECGESQVVVVEQVVHREAGRCRRVTQVEPLYDLGVETPGPAVSLIVAASGGIERAEVHVLFVVRVGRLADHRVGCAGFPQHCQAQLDVPGEMAGGDEDDPVTLVVVQVALLVVGGGGIVAQLGQEVLRLAEYPRPGVADLPLPVPVKAPLELHREGAVVRVVEVTDAKDLVEVRVHVVEIGRPV